MNIDSLHCSLASGAHSRSVNADLQGLQGLQPNQCSKQQMRLAPEQYPVESIDEQNNRNFLTDPLTHMIYGEFGFGGGRSRSQLYTTQ